MLTPEYTAHSEEILGIPRSLASGVAGRQTGYLEVEEFASVLLSFFKIND